MTSVDASVIRRDRKLTLTIRFGGYQGPQSVHTRAAQEFSSAIATAAGTDVVVELQENVTEGGRAAADLLTMVAQDELDICYFSSSYLTKQVSALGAVDLPFHFTNRNDAYAMLDGPVGNLMAEDVARSTNYEVLGYWDNGFRHISNSIRPILSADDCTGMRLRTLDNAFHQKVFRALGFIPTTIDVRDLVPAIKANQVDAQENPLTNIVNFGIHEFQPYVTLTSHFFGSAVLLCNRKRLQSWPAEIASVVRDAATHATACQRQFAEEDDDTCLRRLHDAGIAPHTLNAGERASFQDRLTTLKDEQLAALPVEISDLIEG